MLLHRLVEYSRHYTDAHPFHREREYVWRLDLYSDGRPARLTSLREPDKKGKLRGQRRSTPAVTRTVGVAPQLGADDMQYVFGWGDETTKADRVAQCHTQFVALVNEWAAASGDVDARTAVSFFERGEYHEWERPHEYTAKDGVLIAVDEDHFLTDNQSLRDFWVDEVLRRKSGKNSATGLCLVCGCDRQLVDTIPGKVAKRLVPGAGNDVALISVNEKVFGRELSVGLEHTPICFPCGDAINGGLTHLLESEHAMVYPGQDSIMGWWALDAPVRDVFDVMPQTADPDAVNRLLDRIRSGDLGHAEEAVDEWADGRFCSVTLGGNASRIMVREWIDMPLPDLARNLASWYDDMRMISGAKREPVTHGLWQLVLACGRWEKGSDRRHGRYADLGSNTGQRPKHIQRDLFTRAVRGVPLPRAVLHHVLHRIGSDGRVDTARAALLRLALCHPHDKDNNRMPAELDEHSRDTPYVYGRIFAVLEEIQYQANRHDRAKNNERDQKQENGGELNTTFGDRFLSGAIGNPAPALVAGRKLASAWLRKLRQRRAGTAVALTRRLDNLHELLDPGQPVSGYLKPEQQARFILGYHQQRAHDARQRREHQASTDSAETD